MRPAHTRRAVAIALCALSWGCSDYIARTAPMRQAYERNGTAAALQLAPDPDDSGVDELLVLLDRGMILHAGGRWKESQEVLARAETLSARLDAISFTEEAGILLSNERQRNYRGEAFERLLINVIQALNYAAQGDREGALVEVRRCNERLHKMQQDEQREWSQLAIARLLGGIFYEDDGNLDSAFIDFRAALTTEPQLVLLADPLLRLAKQLGRLQEVDELKARFPGREVPAPLGPGEGELWVIIEAGLAPIKQTQTGRGHGDEGLVEVPMFESRGLPGLASVSIEGQHLTAQSVTSVDSVARKDLDTRLAGLVARAVASTVIKAAIAGAAGAAAKDEGVGWLVFWLLSLGNAADLRSWMSLPNQFQAVRARVAAGPHEVVVSSQGTESKHTVTVRPRGVGLLVLRRY